jgi:hypothetical protein
MLAELVVGGCGKTAKEMLWFLNLKMLKICC